VTVTVTAERSNDNSYIVPCPGGDSKPAPVKDNSDTWCVSLQTRGPDRTGPDRTTSTDSQFHFRSGVLRPTALASSGIPKPEASYTTVPVLTINNSEQEACKLAEAE
jgi:hypothetical protein